MGGELDVRFGVGHHAEDLDLRHGLGRDHIGPGSPGDHTVGVDHDVLDGK